MNKTAHKPIVIMGQKEQNQNNIINNKKRRLENDK
jgi:hypothetical protein